jgi:prepilin-type N-terminal cleavage/methylation domain-containing protein
MCHTGSVTTRAYSRGFTLIEIVMVLAIAGLLLVVVFLAVSGAQRNRRDSQRKTDLGRIASQIEAFASDNAGCYPRTSGGVPSGCPAALARWSTGAPASRFINSTYITVANLKDPLAGLDYDYTGLQNPSPAQPAGVDYQVGSGTTTCDGAASNGDRIYAVRMSLEQGTACRDNL